MVLLALAAGLTVLAAVVGYLVVRHVLYGDLFSEALVVRPPLHLYREAPIVTAESVLALLDDAVAEARQFTGPDHDIPACVLEVDRERRVTVVQSTGPYVEDFVRLEPALRCIRSGTRTEWSMIHPSTRARWCCVAEPTYRGDELIARVVAYEAPEIRLVSA